MEQVQPVNTAVPTAPAGRRTTVRLFVLALITIATMINYLDRAVMGVPAMTAELGISAALMGVPVLGFLVDLCARADPWRNRARPVRHAFDLYGLARALVVLHLAARLCQQRRDSGRFAPGARHRRGAVLPREQPRPFHLVPATGARPG